MSAQPSVAAKTERLLNLVIALLSTRMPLTKARIRAAVPQYHATPSDEAFDRMFERDKDELRELGIPLVTQVVDPVFDDELGYRIDRREYQLPEIAFEPAEVAALALAGRAWTQATLAGPAAAALAKLTADGVALDDRSLVGIEPRLRTADPAFEPLRKAVLERRPVSFGYRKPDATTATVRHVQPWGLAMRRGRWYLTAHDLDRGAERVFRLGRIEGPVRPDGPAGSYEVPPEHEPRLSVDLDAADRDTHRDADPGPGSPAVVRIRDGAGNTLRRRAGSSEPDGAGWSRVTVELHDLGRLAAEVAGYGPDALVVSPVALRGAVVELLAAVRARHTGGLP
ncbi:MAG: WYL domain-containing protein [Dermatophilaceae bacterium]